MQIYVEGPDQLEAQWNKNSCLCVYLRNKPQMSHECSITNDPTHTTAAEPFCKAGWAADLPRMPRTPHQYLRVWWSLTGFQSWPPPSSWRDCTILKKKICSLLHGCCDPPTSFPWPHLRGGEISQPSINPCSSEFTFKSWSCSRESLNEWVNACKYMRECCNLCNLNILPICLLAFSLMDWLSFDILFKITSVKAFHESGVGIVQCCFRIG